jgi:CDGSH-type Zn-finger protein
MSEARITVYPDGPLIVRGDFRLDDLTDGPIETGRTIALCRCGRSAVKPLCDGSHKNARRRPESRNAGSDGAGAASAAAGSAGNGSSPC